MLAAAVALLCLLLLVAHSSEGFRLQHHQHRLHSHCHSHPFSLSLSPSPSPSLSPSLSLSLHKRMHKNTLSLTGSHTHNIHTLSHTLSHTHTCALYATYSSSSTTDSDSDMDSSSATTSSSSSPSSSSVPKLVLLGYLLVARLMKTSAVAASSLFPSTTSSSTSINGWDLYGRIPNDDWLFTNEKLLDPNLLRPSIVEAVVAEMPIVINNFRWRKYVVSVVRGSTMLAVAAVIGYILTLLFGIGRHWFREDQNRIRSVRGFEVPLSARFKNKNSPPTNDPKRKK